MSYVSIPSAQEQQKQQELQAQQVVAQLYVDQEEPELPHETEQYAEEEEEEEVEYNLAHPMIYGQYGQAARPYAARHAYVPHVEPYEKPYEPVEHYADVPVKQPYEEQKEQEDVVVDKAEEQPVETAEVPEQIVEQTAELVLKLVALPVKPELTVEQAVEQHVEEQPMNVDVVKQTDLAVDAPAKPTLTLIALPVKEQSEKPEDKEQEQPTAAAIRVQLPVPEEDYEVPEHVEMCDIASLQQQVEETLAHAVDTVVAREKDEQDVQEPPVVEETTTAVDEDEKSMMTAVQENEEHTAAEETAIEDEQTEETEEDSFDIDTMFGKLLKQLEQIELNHVQKRGEWAAERAVWQAEKMLLEKRLDKEIERRTKAESELAALNKLVDLDLEWKEQGGETAPLSDTLTQEMIKEIQEIEL